MLLYLLSVFFIFKRKKERKQAVGNHWSRLLLQSPLRWVSRSCVRLPSSLSHAWTKWTKALTVMWTAGPLNPAPLPPSSFLLVKEILSSRGAHQISIADLLMPGVSTAPATISHWRWKGNEQAGRWGDREVQSEPLQCTRSSGCWPANVRTGQRHGEAFRATAG